MLSVDAICGHCHLRLWVSATCLLLVSLVDQLPCHTAEDEAPPLFCFEETVHLIHLILESCMRSFKLFQDPVATWITSADECACVGWGGAGSDRRTT